MSADVRVRPATESERAAVANVIDGAALELADDALRDAIATEAALVAVTGEDDRVLGALVLDGVRILAVAVRPNRRGQGIGTRLVTAAAERRDRLVAECDESVRPFWDSLEFAIESADESGRYVGVR